MTNRQVIVATAEHEGVTEVSTHVADLVRRLVTGGEAEPIAFLWNPSPLSEDLAGTVTVAGPPAEGEARIVLGLRRAGMERLASRLKDALVGLWLWRHRRAPVVLVGASCSVILPWLTRHRAPVVWVLVDENGNGDGDGLPLARWSSTIDPADLAVLDHVLVRSAPVGDRIADAARRAGRTPPPITVIGRHDPVLVEPPPPAATATIGLIGGLDDDHGVDLAPRLLWQLERSAGRPVTAVWATCGSTGLPPSVGHDLRNLAIDDRLQVHLLASPGDLPAWLDSVAVVVLPWRRQVDPELLAAIARHGRLCAGFASADDDHPAMASWARFPLVEDLADGAARLLLDDRARLVAASARQPEQVTRRLLSLLLRTGRPDGA